MINPADEGRKHAGNDSLLPSARRRTRHQRACNYSLYESRVRASGH